MDILEILKRKSSTCGTTIAKKEHPTVFLKLPRIKMPDNPITYNPSVLTRERFEKVIHEHVMALPETIHAIDHEPIKYYSELDMTLLGCQYKKEAVFDVHAARTIQYSREIKYFELFIWATLGISKKTYGNVSEKIENIYSLRTDESIFTKIIKAFIIGNHPELLLSITKKKGIVREMNIYRPLLYPPSNSNHSNKYVEMLIRLEGSYY